mmetsp:Transcript_84763/g.245066  ORF Transcript_84763/g.245066 Transcript_84763/m.245066 type:complete len:223 (+) Transcript_84763:578-1246(+)
MILSCRSSCVKNDRNKKSSIVRNPPLCDSTSSHSLSSVLAFSMSGQMCSGCLPLPSRKASSCDCNLSASSATRPAPSSSPRASRSNTSISSSSTSACNEARLDGKSAFGRDNACLDCRRSSFRCSSSKCAKRRDKPRACSIAVSSASNCEASTSSPKVSSEAEGDKLRPSESIRGQGVLNTRGEKVPNGSAAHLKSSNKFSAHLGLLFRMLCGGGGSLSSSS